MSVGGAERSHSVDARPFTPLEHPFFAGKKLGKIAGNFKATKVLWEDIQAKEELDATS